MTFDFVLQLLWNHDWLGRNILRAFKIETKAQSDFQSDFVPEIIQHVRHASSLDKTLLTSITNVLKCNTNMHGRS